MPYGTRAVLVIALFLGLDARAACAPVGFTGGTAVYAGPKAQTMTLANVNGDAWIDAVVAGHDHNYQPIGGLYILLGEPGAQWRPEASLATEENILSVAAGDFDGDGDDDLAYEEIFGSGAGIVHLLQNDGGVFRESARYTFERWSSGLTTGDFNGDRRDDLAFISRDGDGRLLLGSAAGLPEQRTFEMDAGASFPAAADLDGDGFDDLVVGRFDDYDIGAVLIFAGDRDYGLRAPPRVLEFNSGIGSVSIGDFDGSGDRDVLAFGYSRIALVRGAGNPAATPQRVELSPGASTIPAVADVNRDGADDLIYTSGEGVEVVFGMRDGRFIGEGTYFVTGRGPFLFGPVDLAASDFDRDGDVDLTAVTRDGLTVLRNDGTGSFAAPRFATFGHAAGDFNNDGRDDVIDSGGVRLATPHGSIEAAPISERYVRDDILFVKTADVNGDGNLDAIFFLAEAPNGRAGRVRVRLGNGDGTLRLAQEFEMGEDYEDAVVADFNNDGTVDVMTVNFTSDDARARSMALGQGDGTFAYPVDLFGPPFLDGLAAGDFNGDGRVDLAMMSANTPKPLLVAMGLGPGTFTEPAGVGPFASHLVIADLNHDGLSDIIAAMWWGDSATVYVLISRGDGTFVEKPEVSGFVTDLNQLHTGDFNRDGHLDLLLTEGGSTAAEGWMALLAGDGRGNLGPAIPIRSVAWGIAHVGDFDGDGKLDVLDNGFPRLNTCEDGARRRAARHW